MSLKSLPKAGQRPVQVRRRKTSNFIHSGRRNVTDAARISRADRRAVCDGSSSPPYSELRLVLPSKTPASGSRCYQLNCCGREAHGLPKCERPGDQNTRKTKE
jgi:hypothetical protein